MNHLQQVFIQTLPDKPSLVCTRLGKNYDMAKIYISWLLNIIQIISK